MTSASRSVRGLVAVGAVGLSSLSLAPTAMAATFTHRTVVSIDHTRVPDADALPLTNFPVLVSIQNNALKTTANGGFVASSQGYDVVFQGEDAPTCAPAAPPCRLDHEIESYNGTTGTLVAWVRVPAVFDTNDGVANTPIYMYYGDPTITCSQENKNGVWDSSYREVLHLDEPAEHTDSTTNAFTAASRGAVTEGVAGKVGPAVDLASGAAGTTPASLNVSDGTYPTGLSLTFEAWVNFRTSNAGQFIGIVTKGRECLNFDGDPDPAAGFCTVAPCGDWIGLYKLPDGGGRQVFSLQGDYGGPCNPQGLVDSRGAPANVATGTWYHVAGVFNNLGARRLFVNGVQVATDNPGAAACFDAAMPQYTRLGTDSNTNFLDGQLDEVRVSFAARSSDWIVTGYNNQSAPFVGAGGFYSSVAYQAGSWTVGTTACPAGNPCTGGPGTCNLRSIGSAANYVAGTVSTTTGSAVVTGTGTAWVTANRGRGDRITINGTDYTILAVDTETKLRLTAPFVAANYSGAYTIARKFATPALWESCIDGPGGAGCENVASSSLVTDNRGEIGIVYKDATYTTAGTSIVAIAGSTTDANHTITLTADGVNRHYGIAGAGVVFDNGTTNTTRPVLVNDQFVTVEWLEVARGGDTGAHCIDFNPSVAANHGVIRNNIVRNCSGQSIRTSGNAGQWIVADINNNIVYRGAREGIAINDPVAKGSRVRIFNNTVVHNAGGGKTDISTAQTPNPYVMLRNNIVVDDAQTPDLTWNGNALCTNANNCDWWNAASSNNVVGDAAPPTGQWQPYLGPNPHGAGGTSATEASLMFLNSGAGTENLHIKPGSPAIDVGATLSGVVLGDIDGVGRSAPWDIGADELNALPAVGVGCPVGTAPAGPNKVLHGNFDLGKIATGGGLSGNLFTTSAVYEDFNDCPGDTHSTIRTGLTPPDCGGGAQTPTQFPGDPAAGLAAAPNSLFVAGNNLYGPLPFKPYVAWRQATAAGVPSPVSGLQPNTTYTFFLYASNASTPGMTTPVLPSLRFCKGVTGVPPNVSCTTQLNAVDFSIPNETVAGGDVWRRYQVIFTTGAGETTADLAVLDTATDSNGDEFQLTQIGVQACGAATAVSLMSFEAVPSNAAVTLVWRTGAEVDNLGFHVYRAPSPDGPWARLTTSLIPGQGFSVTGASYAWRDGGVQNGTRYYYRLEDVDTHSLSTFHGPVSAVPLADAAPPPDGGGSGGSGGSGSGSGSGGGPSSPTCPRWALEQLGSSASYTCESHGDPAATSFRVLSRSARSALVELQTGGFLTARDSAGRVRALVPDFDSLTDPLAPALPLKRVRLDGVVGLQARIGSIDARGDRFFAGLAPAAVGYARAVVATDGTVRTGRREARLGILRAVFPRVQARLAGEGFQGEDKTLSLELMPLRYDALRRALVLSRRLTVRVDFAGVEPSETGRGRLGRRVPRPRPDSSAYAFLGTFQKGLHSVAFETLFPGSSRPLDLASLRLTRAASAGALPGADSGSSAGQERVPVPFLVQPRGTTFGPGSRLFFYVDVVASSTSFSAEVVYALERGTGGVSMSLVASLPRGPSSVSSRGFASFETNRIYAPDVLDIEDLWQWESLGSGVSKTKPFALDGIDASSPEAARLVVYLQGGSDSPSVVDHHVEVFVNGALVTDETFDGAVPHRVQADVPVSLLATANELTVTNVGDTDAASRVFLDRFEVAYPQVAAARSGSFDGSFSSAGTAEVAGVASPAALLDVTGVASWLTGYQIRPALRFRAEAGHRYVAVSEEALLSPRVFFPEPSARLRSAQNQADYVLVAPRAFLAAADPLLERRQSQGLRTFAASLEEIASSFGGGQVSAEAIRDFLSFAYHEWRRPSPRYVLLLGDANQDPRHFNPASQPSPMPFLLQRTSYIWTASDPALAAVNGEDALPDLAIGRLPATTVEQAQTMVGKILDWETQGQSLDGPVALVADNPDAAGDFEADARDIEASFLAGRETTEVFLGQIGNRDVARARILDAFNGGLSLISYVGHGGGAVWAGENILNSADPASLLAQPRQPFMLTMNCLNGYFIAPFYESLAEGFLKAEGRGTIGAFSPSGLSLEGPAHVYHRAVMQEITAGGHARLGDAVLAAQKAYAQSGAFPELLAIYHLFGDPATKLR